MSDTCDQIEQFGKAIGNVTRYNIVQELVTGPKNVSEIVKAIKCSQSVASQHLKILKQSNIVISERNGQEVSYRLNAKHALFLLKALTSNFKMEHKK